jgi:hypothetical protein
MGLYMETTGIAPDKTAAEIQSLLVQAGAGRIMTEYTEGKKLKGLSFTLMIKGTEVPFSLPARLDPVFLYLQKKRSPLTRDRKQQEDRLQAERVAWRQLLRWIQAQIAMIDTGMVAAEEVFLPYVQTAPNQTLFERMTSTGQIERLALQPAPKDMK